MPPVRKEVHTRSTFALQKAKYWLKRLNASADSGNLLTCVGMRKLLQARRVYIHYTNEYQKNQGLPLKK